MKAKRITHFVIRYPRSLAGSEPYQAFESVSRYKKGDTLSNGAQVVGIYKDRYESRKAMNQFNLVHEVMES